MKPVSLATPRLVLDLPTIDDVDLATQYCQDPVFERFLTTPWPYTRDDALGFFLDVVPGAWRRDTEYTWAIRVAHATGTGATDIGQTGTGQFGGLIGYRPVSHSLGFWLGAPHRGHGYMTEATHAVLDWVFANGHDGVLWECVVGNQPSVSVARKVGFTYTGEAPAEVASRDGSHPASWHAIIRSTDSRTPKAGWPT
jgi:RimJ/RimL family protein N-acetyltransferase